MIKNLLPGKTIAIKKIKASSILSALLIHLKYIMKPQKRIGSFNPAMQRELKSNLCAAKDFYCMIQLAQSFV